MDSGLKHGCKMPIVLLLIVKLAVIWSGVKDHQSFKNPKAAYLFSHTCMHGLYPLVWVDRRYFHSIFACPHFHILDFFCLDFLFFFAILHTMASTKASGRRIKIVVASQLLKQNGLQGQVIKDMVLLSLYRPWTTHVSK